MKRNKFYLTVILTLFALSSITVCGQTLYVPGGSSNIGNSTNNNIGVGVSVPNYQLEVYKYSATEYPEIALTHSYSIKGSATKVWKMYNDHGVLRFGYGSATLGYPSSFTNYISFNSGSMTLDNSFLYVMKNSGNLLKLDNVIVSRELDGLLWNMSGQKFRITGGSLSLSGFDTYISVNASPLTAGSPAILISDDGGLVKAFKTDVNSVETLSILTNGDITTSGDITTNGINASSGIITVDDLTSTNIYVKDASDDINFKVNQSGYVWAREINVTLENPFPDYVFDEEYELMDLDELELFISEYGHLPNMPTAEEVKEEGIELAEMNVLLVEKVEELTLYILELQKEIDALKQKANN